MSNGTTPISEIRIWGIFLFDRERQFALCSCALTYLIIEIYPDSIMNTIENEHHAK